MISERQVQTAFIALVSFAIFFNNILRWYPFPAGRSANELSTLEDNLIGIAVNILTYCCILALTLLDRRAFEIPPASVLLYAYCFFITVQSPFRMQPFMELLRSLGTVAMILSANRLASALGKDPAFLRRFMNTQWVTLAGTVFLGTLIGVLKDGSVNWGAERSQAFAQVNRAEFFFFHILPYPTFALSLAELRAEGGRWRRSLAVLSLATIFALAVMTMTRSIIFSCVLVALVALFRRSRPAFVTVMGAVTLAAYIFSGQARDLAVRARVYTGSDADFTTNRAALVAFNIQLFEEEPIFGHGAQEARRRIQYSETVAKTEHGYTIHLSSYGMFAALFITYVLVSVVSALRFILTRSSPGGAFLLADACQASAIATTGLGLVWLFGSGSAFYDWMGMFFLSLAPVLRQEARSTTGLPAAA